MTAVQPATEIKTVLLPLDGRPLSHAALPVARALATLVDAALHIIYVTNQPMTQEDLQKRLSLNAEDMHNTVFDVVSGDPVEGILRVATRRPHPIIVMTTHSSADRSERGLGPVTESVLQVAPCPMLLVPPEHTYQGWQLRQILLPQDGSPATASAVAPVMHLVQHTGAKLLVVHVSGADIRPPQEPGAITVPRYVDQPQHEWPAWTEEFLERVRSLSGEPEKHGLRFFLALGKPGSEIRRIAEEQQVDVIVLPWHGSLEARHASALKVVLLDAPAPILLLPNDRRKSKRPEPAVAEAPAEP
jgi:nucleotide-binding universal stress UspA family protein